MKYGEETKNLLEKLYNLKSPESELLHKIDLAHKEASEISLRTQKEKRSLENSIEQLNKEESILETEGESLKNALGSIANDNFNVVLNKLGINFDPKDLKEKVELNLPATVEKLKQEKTESNLKLNELKKEMNDALTTIKELEIRKDEAVSNQLKLEEYFKLSLKGNINITREELTTLLSKFELSEEEQRNLAKILMFPEDALFEYNENLTPKDEMTKSFSEVFAEARSEEKTPEIEPEKEKPEDVLGSVIKPILENYNFSPLDFTSSDLEYLEKNLNEQILEKNIKLISKIGINKDLFVENIELFNDIELENKLSVLLEVGKMPFDIYLNPNVLVKYSFHELQKTIASLKESGLDPQKVPLMAF